MNENLQRISSFIGVPYDHFSLFGFNCWSFVAAVYHELLHENLIEFKLKSGTPREISSVFSAALASGEHQFKQVEEAKDLDLILFKNKKLHHVGIMIAGKVAHCDKALGGVVIQDFKEITKHYSEFTLWRK